ncbi:DUF11 domain-containing protein [Nonomuraea jiangxiensis]|uniref:Conserved repeat domain-containing protein n=1 Tax=Nonomuraea jiangxiensis TaxID=633440 RepID=A0A1G7Z2I1_9ACTN|nr:DUF11 domain-containing protein [Nonomuraea jiangxiensis]SDH02903.1 conserved repeat domain-containing protein [Nonomuraea jiangxiensis]
MGRPGIAAIIALTTLGGWAAPTLAGTTTPAAGDRSFPGAAPRSLGLRGPGLQGPGLRVAGVLSPNPVIAGAESVHMVTVTNTGDQTVERVTVADTLDPNTVPGPLPAGCSTVDQTVTCGGPRLTIGPGESLTYHIPVVTDPALPDGTNLRARAEATTAGTTTDSAQIIGQTRTLADVELRKSAPARANANGGSTYTLTVTNHGPSRATDVTVRDPAAGDRATITGRPPECPGGGPALDCPLGTLEPHESRTFAVTITPHAAGTIESCATVHTAARERDTDNNRSCASTTVDAVQGAATPEPTSVVDMTTTPLLGRAEILATPPDLRRRAGRHERERGAAHLEAAPPALPLPTPGTGTRGHDALPPPAHHHAPLPVTGLSFWIFGLGAAVLLSIGLLVRSFSRPGGTGGTLAGAGDGTGPSTGKGTSGSSNGDRARKGGAHGKPKSAR